MPKLRIYDENRDFNEIEELFEFAKEISGSRIEETISYRAPFSVLDDKEEYELFAPVGYRVGIARIKGAKRNRYGSPLDVETVYIDDEIFDLFLNR
jgi:hypothetical protein